MIQHDPAVVPGSRAATGGLIAVMALFLAVSSGCSGGMIGDAPLIATGYMWTGPRDGATNVDVGALDLLFKGTKEVTSDTGIADLKSHLVLKTWPEETVVPSTIEEDHDSFRDSEVLRLVPTAPLDERWYLMEVTNLLDSGIAWENPAGKETLRTRFRVGSAPRVRAIEICDKTAQSSTAVFVHVSEPVDAQLPAEQIISIAVSGTKQDCTLNEATPQGGFEFICPSPSLIDSQITISAGLKAPAGAEVPPGSFTIDRNSLSPSESGCVGIRPSI